MKYHPLIEIAFMWEDRGHEIDWEEVYSGINFCNEPVPNTLDEFLELRKKWREKR